MNTTETYTTTLNGDTVRFEEAQNQSVNTDGGYVGRDGDVFVLYCLDYETVEVTDPNTLEVVALFDESDEHISPDALAKQGFTAVREVKE